MKPELTWSYSKYSNLEQTPDELLLVRLYPSLRDQVNTAFNASCGVLLGRYYNSSLPRYCPQLEYEATM